MLPDTSIAIAAASPSRSSPGIADCRACSICPVSRGASATRPTDGDPEPELSRHRPTAIINRPMTIQALLYER